jgi:hypothetical protein
MLTPDTIQQHNPTNLGHVEEEESNESITAIKKSTAGTSESQHMYDTTHELHNT